MDLNLDLKKVKRNIKERRFLFILVAVIGFGSIGFLVFGEKQHLILSSGIFSFIMLLVYLYFYYMKANGSKKGKVFFENIKYPKTIIVALLFIMISSLGVFSLLSYVNSEERLSYTEGSINDDIDNVKYNMSIQKWYFETDCSSEEGFDPKGDFRFPLKNDSYLYHYINKRDSSECMYKYIVLYTAFEFENDEANLLIYSSPSKNSKDEDKTLVYDLTLSFELNNNSDSIYKYVGYVEDIDGTIDSNEKDYYFFLFNGTIEGLEITDPNVPESFYTQSKLVIVENVEDVDYWSYTLEPLGDYGTVLLGIFGESAYLLMLEAIFIGTFTVLSLVLLAFGAYKRVALYFLGIIILVGILVLLILFPLSENFTVIRQLLSVARQGQKVFGPILTKFFRAFEIASLFLGVVFAVLLWVNTIGAGLLICCMMYMVFHTVSGFFETFNVTNIIR